MYDWVVLQVDSVDDLESEGLAGVDSEAARLTMPIIQVHGRRVGVVGEVEVGLYDDSLPA